MYLEMHAHLGGERLRQWLALLESAGLKPDEHAGQTACLYSEEDRLLASGSLANGLISCVAVDPEYRGEGLLAPILTALSNAAHDAGRDHLFLYTKPDMAPRFEALGFTALAETPEAVLMENRARGLDRFLEGVRCPEAQAPVGAIVAHCDPFTNGHRFLVETASKQAAFVYVFVLSEDRGRFPAQARLDLVRAGAADLPNVRVHETGPYMVSAALFPTYFLKDATQAATVHGNLDLRLFGSRIAPALGITRRFVGTEPYSAVTADYNRRMRETLPAYGVEVVEIPRLAARGAPVSASRVRALYEARDWETLEALVPADTLAYLKAPLTDGRTQPPG